MILANGWTGGPLGLWFGMSENNGVILFTRSCNIWDATEIKNVRLSQIGFLWLFGTQTRLWVMGRINDKPQRILRHYLWPSNDGHMKIQETYKPSTHIHPIYLRICASACEILHVDICMHIIYLEVYVCVCAQDCWCQNPSGRSCNDSEYVSSVFIAFHTYATSSSYIIT